MYISCIAASLWKMILISILMIRIAMQTHYKHINAIYQIIHTIITLMDISTREIHIIQEIHSKVHTLDLPNIVVVGAQSSGKSSVLESLIKKDILPRGTEIVTRCPIIIHLKNTNTDERVEIVNTNKTFYDFIEAKHSIQSLMNDICGIEKDISRNPIILNLYLTNSLDFTIIDLPGITKIPIGTQPPDIEEKVISIINEYASSTSALILAVINSNVDISNSEELKLCKKIDPEYNRTLGVLTKLDLMDKYTDCVHLLDNNVYPLKLGYIGVVNRSQKDIMSGIRYEEFEDREMEFFRNSAYSKYITIMNDERKACEKLGKATKKSLVTKNYTAHIGSKYLRDTISKLYRIKIKDCIPSVKSTIYKMIKSLENDIASSSYNSPFSIKINYHSALQAVARNKATSGMFTYDGVHVVYDLIKIFKNLKVSYDYTGVEKELVYDLSVFINEDILKSIIKKNMNLIRDKAVELQDKFLSIVYDKIANIKSKSFPDMAKYLNDKMIEYIQNIPLHDKINEHISIHSNVIGNSNTFMDINTTKGIFGNYINIKNNMKHEMIVNFTKIYLDNALTNIKDHLVKLNYYYVVQFFESNSVEYLVHIDIDGHKELLAYKDKIAVHKLEMDKLTEVCVLAEELHSI